MIGMRNILSSLLLTLSLTAALPTNAIADQGTEAAAPQSERIQLVVGKSRFVDLDFAIGTVIVGDPAIADIVVVNPNRFYLLGNASGTTNIQILDDIGQVEQVLDLVVGIDADEVARAIRSALPGSSVSAHSINGRIRLGGEVADDAARERAVDIASSYSDQPIIDTMVTSSPKQVFLQVQIVEASHSVGQELGMNLTSVNLSVDGTLTSAGNTSNSFYSATTTIDAMVQQGIARYLATPTLTALSGQTASFLAGGEIPVPVSVSDPGQVEYKEFGVRLSFTPNVQENGLINLVLEPEVSQIDTNSSYVSNGFSVPGFSTRRASTTVELRDGESFVIAGLMQTTEVRGTTGLPAFSELPVIGALFRASELSDKNTELLIIVTPSMTRPAPRGANIETPLDSTRASRGAELFLDGDVERNAYDLRDLLTGEGISGHFGPILTIGGEGAFVAQ